VDKVAQGQVFLKSMYVPPANIIPHTLHPHSFIYHQCYMILARNGIIK